MSQRATTSKREEAQQSTSSSPSNHSLNDEIHASLLAFLKRLGYRQTEQIFREEARHAGIETVAFELRAEQDSSLQPAIILEKLREKEKGSEDKDEEREKEGGLVSGLESTTSASASSDNSSTNNINSSYEQMYGKLKKWTYESLDIYRDELYQALYPMFVHCFLDLIAKSLTANAHKFFEKFREDFNSMHGDELMKFKSLNDSFQLKENSLASTYRNNKYNLTMSAYSFQLLINFLQENNLFILLKILNQYLNIRVLVNRPSTSSLNSSKTSADKDARPQGIVGLSQTLQSQINNEPLNWGVYSLDPANEPEILRRLRNDLAASGTLKTQDQLNNTVNQIRKSLNSINSNENAPKVSYLPRPPAGVTELNQAVERIKGISNRAVLSSTTLPSICCYTIHNSYEAICSVDFSPDFSLLAMGSRESYIDVWSLTKQKMRTMRPSTELSAMSTTDLEGVDNVFESEGTWSKRLVGHSGPVYACRFSPDNQLLYSCSQDGTIRLWSLSTFSSIVAYKGHNGPVWDIDVGPSGHYFVSGSADKTARLWSTQGLQPLRLFVGHLSDVDVVKFHPNSNYVFTGSSDKSIRMWDIQKGHCVRLFIGHSRGVSSLAVSPNGRLLASGDTLGTIKIWDISEGKLYKTLPAIESSVGSFNKSQCVWSLSFCQDGKILTSCTADNRVKLWDVLKPAATAPTSVSSSSSQPQEEPLASFPTKQTPIMCSRFTARNVLCVVGAFSNE